MIMAYHLLLQLLQAREGEEEDDHGQLKKETVAVKQEVADDFMANLGFGSSTDEWALSPDQTALALPDPGLAPPEPEGHGYNHGLPTTFSKQGRGSRRSWTVQTRNRRGQTRSRR